MTMLFLSCMPLSWYAAWDASSSFLTVGFSVMMPTWGLAYWGLNEVFGSGSGFGIRFVIALGSGILGIIGAGVSLVLFKVLDPKRLIRK